VVTRITGEGDSVLVVQEFRGASDRFNAGDWADRLERRSGFSVGRGWGGFGGFGNLLLVIDLLNQIRY
jgi:hypothetical protein